MSQMARMSNGLAQITRQTAKQSLKTSQGFPSQWSKTALVARKAGKPAASGHAISRHVQGAKSAQPSGDEAKRKRVKVETKFKSLDGAAKSMHTVLTKPSNLSTIEQLEPKKRCTCQGKMPVSETIEIRIKEGGKSKTYQATVQLLKKLGISSVNCKWVVEHRTRPNGSYLHVVTGYPAFTKSELEKVAAAFDAEE